MRKKHQPGCPCCEPNTDPCGCGVSILEVQLSCSDTFTLLGPAPYPECNYLIFSGFTEMSGTYYVTLPEEETIVVVGTWYNDNGVQYDGLLYYYCVAVVVRLVMTRCYATLDITWWIFSREDYSATCPTFDDLDGWSSTSWNAPYEWGFDVCDTAEDTIVYETGSEDCPANTTLTYTIFPYVE